MKFKFLQIVLLMLSGFAFSQSPAELLQVKDIDDYTDTLENNAKVKKYEFTIQGTDKTILYSYEKTNNEIVKMSRSWTMRDGEYNNNYTYHFILKNGKRIYYSEGIFYEKYNDKEDMGGWNVQFYLNDKKVIYTSSLGHGKTESDDWDSDAEIEANFNFMLKTVKKFDKNRMNSKKQ